METIASQTKEIKKYLESGKSLTPLEGLYQFGCFRLGARIWDLKNEGMHIKTEIITIISAGKNKRVAKYTMVKNINL